MIVKTTELVGISVANAIDEIEKTLIEKQKKVKYFRKEKDQIEAMKQWRQAFIEIIGMLKSAEKHENDMIKNIFIEGSKANKKDVDGSFDEFWKKEFERKQVVEEKQEEVK